MAVPAITTIVGSAEYVHEGQDGPKSLRRVQCKKEREFSRMGVYKASPGLARHVNRTSGGNTCCAVVATWAGYILVGLRCLIMAMFVSKWTEIRRLYSYAQSCSLLMVLMQTTLLTVVLSLSVHFCSRSRCNCVVKFALD